VWFFYLDRYWCKLGRVTSCRDSGKTVPECGFVKSKWLHWTKNCSCAIYCLLCGHCGPMIKGRWWN
jgi:hypothetical protein